MCAHDVRPGEDDRSRDDPDDTVRYYSSDGAVSKYAEAAKEGLTGVEREVILSHFTDRGGRVLDLGCGVGRTTGPLRELGYEVVGIDVSEQMIRTATTRFPDVEFQVGDASRLAFRDETFEYVLFSWNGLAELPPASRRAALREIHRVLKPEGVFAFNNFNAITYYFLRGIRYPRAVLRFWIRNVRSGRARSRYKTRKRNPHGDESWLGENYFIDPLSQLAQLREHGFDPVEIIGGGRLPKYVSSAPYYVARKGTS